MDTVSLHGPVSLTYVSPHVSLHVIPDVNLLSSSPACHSLAMMCGAHKCAVGQKCVVSGIFYTVVIAENAFEWYYRHACPLELCFRDHP